MREDGVHRKLRAPLWAGPMHLYVYASVSGSLRTNRYMERLPCNFHGTRTHTGKHGDSTT